MNDSWGYQPYDDHYKTPNMIVRTFTDVISMGGNLLLDIGPKSDGTIPEKQVEILKNLGRWTSKNKEAVYGTHRGIPFENFKGKSSVSKTGKSIFLYLEETKGFVKIHGLGSRPDAVRIVGDENAKIHFSFDNNTVIIDLSHIKFDQDVTTIELVFKNFPVLLKDFKRDLYPLSDILQNKNPEIAVYDIADALHSGKNLLDGSGMTSDGQDMKILQSVKANPQTLQWISKHAEALYETGKGLPEGHYSGMSALSKDRQTIYLFVEGTPTGPIAFKGIKNNIARTRIVGDGSIISHKIYNKLYWSDTPGIIYIDIPKDRLDKNMTVIAVLLDKPIELYREKVNAIESNL